MGLDFIRNAAKPFSKGLDRSRVALATPDLFTLQPQREPRIYVAKVLENEALNDGENLCIVMAQDGEVAVRRGLKIVANIESPPPELIEASKASHDIAFGTVGTVYRMSNMAEVSIC